MNTWAEEIDSALEIGRRELEFLRAGLVDEAGDAASLRSAKIEKLWDLPREAMDDGFVLGKFVELEQMQSMLREEGNRLREKIRSELLKTRANNKAYAGYGKVASGSRSTLLAGGAYLNATG